MTTRGEAALIDRAKRLATPVVSHVAANLRLERLLSDCTWQDLAALVIVLAEAADHAKLKAVVQATEDSEPVPLRQVQLRKAHAEVTRRRKAYEAVTPELATLEREYQREYNRTRPGRTGSGVPGRGEVA